MQLFFGGNRRPREVVIPGDVGNPGGRAADPDAAGQADARSKGEPAARAIELGDRDPRQMPDLLAAQHLALLVDEPEEAHGPSQVSQIAWSMLGIASWSVVVSAKTRVTAYCAARRCSARLRSVMSRAIFEAPMMRPSLSLIRDTVRDTSMCVPSFLRRTVSKCSIRFATSEPLENLSLFAVPLGR